jgi:pimeloyl-ACP methyl ester carboxylesterase
MVVRLVDQWRVLCGRDFRFDEEAWRARAEGWVARGQNPSCPHIRLGPQVFGVDRHHELAGVRVPTLVMHGTDDPMFPHVHGQHIAATIPQAGLELLEGRGHDLHLDAAIGSRVARHILDT